MDLKATISADVVASTSLSVDSMILFNESIKNSIEEIESHFPNAWGRLVKGDSIEFVFDSPKDVLRVALILKACVKAFAVGNVCSSKFKKNGLRVAIGIGPMRIVDKERDIMDGESIYTSGRALTDEKASSDFFRFFGTYIMSYPELNIMASMANILIERSKEKSCMALYYRLLGCTPKVIAKKMGVGTSSVSQALTRVGWSSIKSFVDYYESLNF